LLAYVTGEVRRELVEEAGVSLELPVDVRVLAVYRDLARGGKPDVLCVARIPLLASDVVSGGDLGSHVDLGRVSGLEQLASALREACGAHSASTGLRLAAALADGPGVFAYARSALLSVC
jgi:hypothetical protein